MTQEDKELLLKDLSARLPYGIICRYKNEDRPLYCVHPTQYYKISLDNAINVKHNGVENCVIEEVKPYLFPLSSMTEEQQEEFDKIYADDMQVVANNLKNRLDRQPYETNFGHFRHIDWLNKNHFDYRGLIEKGLAIDATSLNIY